MGPGRTVTQLTHAVVGIKGDFSEPAVPLVEPFWTSCPCKETVLTLTGEWHYSRSGRKPGRATPGGQWKPFFGFIVTFTILMPNGPYQARLEMQQPGRVWAGIPGFPCHNGKAVSKCSLTAAWPRSTNSCHAHDFSWLAHGVPFLLQWQNWLWNQQTPPEP